MDELYMPRELGNGLVLRWSTPDDIEEIGRLSATVFRQKSTDPLDDGEKAWIRDLSSGRHPLAEANGGLLVEDTHTHKAVASLWTMHAPWRYGDVAFNIGRPEEVVADPEYRNRGLIRALFERFHSWSERQGHVAQGITGIEYFYRQFGYEYAVDLGGSCTVMFGNIPALPPTDTDPFMLRPATADDLPFLQNLYEHAQRQSLVSSDIPMSYWQWQLNGVDHTSKQGWRMLVAVEQAGTATGAFILPSLRWGTALTVNCALWEQEKNLAAAIRPLLRALQAYAPMIPPAREPKEPDRIVFNVAAKDRFYEVLSGTVTNATQPPYAWYVRVPDLPQFMTRIAPVLEKRLQGSAVAGFDGELRLDFYRGGMLMKWEHGRLGGVEPWRRQVWGTPAHAGFPPLVFLQMLFGRRSLDDLRYAYADVWADKEMELVLRTLFPSKASQVLVLN